MTLNAPADVVRDVRRTLGDRLFARVAGPEGARRRERVHGTEGPRWFPEDAAIRRVHGDASMFVGGIRALLLQSLHPLAIAGVMDHSGFEGDPWGRLQRTSYFLAVTTFGTADDAERMVAAVRSVHERVVGTAPDGRPYAASDPHLLRWVHVAEIDSFLAAHQRYGAHRLDAPERDAYVADAARVAEALMGLHRVTTQVRGRAPRPDQGLPTRAARDAGRPAGGPVPAAAPAAGTGRPRALLRAGGGRRRADARVGPSPAAAALPPGHRADRGPGDRDRTHPDDPLGDGTELRRPLANASPAPSRPAAAVTP